MKTVNEGMRVLKNRKITGLMNMFGERYKSIFLDSCENAVMNSLCIRERGNFKKSEIVCSCIAQIMENRSDRISHIYFQKKRFLVFRRQFFT